jgi:hypothetical protein
MANDNFHTAMEEESPSEQQYEEIYTTLPLHSKRSMPKRVKSASNNENASPNPEIINNVFSIGDRVRVVKKGHKKDGMSGIIEKKTRCYIFFKDGAGNVHQTKQESLALLSGEQSSIPAEKSVAPVDLATKSKNKSEKKRQGRTIERTLYCIPRGSFSVGESNDGFPTAESHFFDC